MTLLWRLFLAFFLAFWGAGRVQAVELTLLFTSDQHGWLSHADLSPRRKPAGLAHLVGQIRALRLADPELLLLDAGDLLTGSPLSRYADQAGGLAQGPFVQLVQSLGYDAVAVGNHDLEVGLAALETMSQRGQIPWTSANLRRQGRPVFAPWRRFQRQGLSVLVVGLTTPGLPLWLGERSLQGSGATPPRQALEEALAQGPAPDLVIGLFHVGMDALRDREVALAAGLEPPNDLEKILKGMQGRVHLVLSGHDHRPHPRKAGEPIPLVQGVPVVAAGAEGSLLHKISLKLTPGPGGKRKIQVQAWPLEAEEVQASALPWPPGYLDWLHQPLAWSLVQTQGQLACLNQVLSQVTALPGQNASLLPPLRSLRPSARPLVRADLWRLTPYDNRGSLVRLSRRDLHLLTHPLPHQGWRRLAFNQQVELLWQSPPPPAWDNPWWVDPKAAKKEFLVLLADYHLHGGGGLAGSVFLQQKGQLVAQDQQSFQARLFAALSQKAFIPPEACRGVLVPARP